MNAMINEAGSEHGRPEPIFGSMLIALGLIIMMRFNRNSEISAKDEHSEHEAEVS